MKTTPVTQTITCCFFLLSFTLLTAQNPAPGGVQGAGMWYHQADDSAIIGNRHTFNLLAFEDSLQSLKASFERATTFFIVLRPAFEQASGKEFLRFGDVRIFDDHIDHGRSSITLDFSDGEPKIITIQSQRPHRYALKSDIEVAMKDSTLFDLAEVVLYPGLKSRKDIRKVNSYLALKYSITITENSDSRWRDYWREDDSFYWNTKTDRLFDRRVLGIGKSENERFDQYQTATSSGSFLLIALDSVQPLGRMPEVQVDEDAFIVLSERRDKGPSSLPCESESAQVNPLWNWKLKLHDWASTARQLVIRVEKPNEPLVDSLFLYDGSQRIFLPITFTNDTLVEYRVDLKNLRDYRHYFFTHSSESECENIDFHVDREGNLVVEVLGRDAQPWLLETQSLDDGLLITETISGDRALRPMDPGQYMVTVRDREGEIAMSDVVVITPGSENETALLVMPDIRVYPNPAARGQEATLLIQRLPNEQPIEILVSDVSGRVLQNERLDHLPTIERTLLFDMPGVYTITVRQGETVYGLKLIIAAN